MKKILVSMIAIFATVGTTMAADTNADCTKPKKYRVIYISANDSDPMYGDPAVLGSKSNGAEPVYSEMLLGSDGYLVDSDSGVAPLFAPRTRNWYIGGRLGLHLLTWKNKYSASPSSAVADASFDHDDYTFEPVFGGGIFGGYHINDSWRADLEFGYISRFTDSDNGFSFKISTPYLMANAYYDVYDGLYAGVGLGLSFTRATLDWEYFVDNSASKTRTSLSGALMLGYNYSLSESVVLDLRYRIAGFAGPKLTRGVSHTDPADPYNGLDSIETKTGFILDNSFMIGLRYEF